MSTTFTTSEVNNCFSIYHSSWITSGPKSNFTCLRETLFETGSHFVFVRLNSTWLITSELANQCVRKALFTCVVYTNCKIIIFNSTDSLIQNIIRTVCLCWLIWYFNLKTLGTMLNYVTMRLVFYMPYLRLKQSRWPPIFISFLKQVNHYLPIIEL